MGSLRSPSSRVKAELRSSLDGAALGARRLLDSSEAVAGTCAADQVDTGAGGEDDEADRDGG